jgi:hypothetical protein
MDKGRNSLQKHGGEKLERKLNSKSVRILHHLIVQIQGTCGDGKSTDMAIGVHKHGKLIWQMIGEEGLAPENPI